MGFESCRHFGDETSEECAEYEDRGHRECERYRDRGYDRCDRYEDRGYDSCNDWDRRCCTWWPCSWLCSLITWICRGWVWISNVVCVAWVWVSRLVCVAWYWVANLVCVAFVRVTEVLCIIFVPIVSAFFRLVERLIGGLILAIRGTVWVNMTIFGTACRRASAGVAAFDDGFADFPIVDDEGDDAASVPGIPGGANRSLFARRSYPPSGLSIQFLGTNSIFISDAQTHLLIDPYFTRPHVSEADLVLCARTVIEPDPEVIARVLELAEIDHVDAILTTHAHYDHALDLAEVSRYLAERNDGVHPRLFGSQSIRHVGVGGGIPASRITVLDASHPDSAVYEIGAFRVTFIEGRHIHVPIVGSYMSGEISRDIVPPANLFAYKEGGTYAIFIEHDLGSILNLGSANCRSGAFDDIGNVDNLILGIAGFDKVAIRLTDILTYRLDFYREVVEATSPRRILFTHWDDFSFSLGGTPRWFGDPLDSHSFFANQNPDLEPDFLPIWGFVALS